MFNYFLCFWVFFFFQAEDGIRDGHVTGVQTCALPIFDHSNVVPVYDAGEADGHLYIAMRYVEGTDLRSLLRDMGTLHPAEASGILSQIAAALDAAHELG